MDVHPPHYRTFVSQSSFDVPFHDFSEYNKERDANVGIYVTLEYTGVICHVLHLYIAIGLGLSPQ